MVRGESIELAAISLHGELLHILTNNLAEMFTGVCLRTTIDEDTGTPYQSY